MNNQYYWFNYDTDLWQEGDNFLRECYLKLKSNQNQNDNFSTVEWRSTRYTFQKKAYFVLKKNGSNKIVALGEIHSIQDNLENQDTIHAIDTGDGHRRVKLNFRWISSLCYNIQEDDSIVVNDPSFNLLQGGGLQLNEEHNRLYQLLLIFCRHPNPYVKSFIQMQFSDFLKMKNFADSTVKIYDTIIQYTKIQEKYDFTNSISIEKIINNLQNSELSLLNTGSRGSLSAALQQYKEFLSIYENIETTHKNRPKNLIRFGAPGTGKSYKIKKDLENIPSSQIKRVVFYPDYSNSQFVGSYKPTMRDEKIKYEFVPGPFLKTVFDAYEDSQKNYYLVIEEINRANAASVFGDMFQLLDRNSEGESEYEVDLTQDIITYITASNNLITLKAHIKNNPKIKIPRNMYIWATMNPADQGVFPLDTAFKRRWEFEYDSLYPDPSKSEEIIDFDTTFKNKILMYLFEDIGRHKRNKIFQVSVSNTLSSLFKKFDEEQPNPFMSIFLSSSQEDIPQPIEPIENNRCNLSSSQNHVVKLRNRYYSWESIRRYINVQLDKADICEDKQLGYFFISGSILKSETKKFNDAIIVN